MLFDRKKRNLDSEKPYDMPHFTFLDNCCRKPAAFNRKILNKWFSEYPNEHKHQLKTRFTSVNGYDHYAAYFELFVYQLLKRLGYKVDVHKNVQGCSKQPDFAAYGLKDELIYVECSMVAGKSTPEMGKERIVAIAKSQLQSKLRSMRFNIGWNFHKYPDTQINYSYLVREVQNWLDDLCHKIHLENNSNHSYYDFGKWFLIGGAEIFIYPIPKEEYMENIEDESVRSYVDMYDVGIIDVRRSIESKVKDKGTKYGNLNAPYVIAIYPLEDLISDITFLNQLMGKPSEFRDWRKGKSIYVKHAPPSVWQGMNGPTLTRVSGVLGCNCVTAWSFKGMNARLFINPWAKYPVSELSPMMRLTRYQHIEGEYSKIEGEPAHKILGLPACVPRD